jgi:hypothetical protein
MSLRTLLIGRPDAPAPGVAPGAAPDPEAIGICCSGGGIRSAAFNLGALQSLQRAGVVTDAKYLAAVSGGSYMAASLCMVAKTAPVSPPPDDPNAAGADDSDPALVTTDTPPYHPGSPEVHYLRNHCSYLAPTGAAKLFLGFRVLMGLLFNLFFLGLVAFAVGIALAKWLYSPAFGHLEGKSCGKSAPDCFSASVPAGAQLALLIGCGAVLVVGVAVLLWRVRSDDSRLALETWSVRLIVLEALLALVLVVIPILIAVARDVAETNGSAPADGSVSSPGLPAIGGGGVVSLLVAVLLHLRTDPAAALKDAKGAAGFLRKAGRRVRTAFIYLAGAIAGPVVLLAILVAGAWLTLAYGRPDWIYWTLAGSLALFVFLYFIADLNTWSLHPFYRRRLCTAFALKRVTEGALERDFGRLVPLSRSGVNPGPSNTRWPTLVVCAAANVSDPGSTPPGRGVTSFTFTPDHIGGPLVGTAATEVYEKRLGRNRQRDITLPAAVAMSGAALSPSMGKLTRKPFVFLMALANVRLGVWVPNPQHVHDWMSGPLSNRTEQPIGLDGQPSGKRDIIKRPRPSYLFRELMGSNRLDARFLYVSDGGHYENLGLVELLRRGCTTVYCFDAGGGTGCGALGDAIALARSELQIEIAIHPGELHEDDDGFAKSDCVKGTITYPDGETGTLFYVRSVMTKDLPFDVLAYRQADPLFPHHSTADQLYDDQKFEAYRALGEAAAEHVRTLQEFEAAIEEAAEAAKT